MKTTRRRSGLSMVLAGVCALTVWSIAFAGTHANATMGRTTPDGNSASAHANGHGNDDSQPAADSNGNHSNGTSGTSGDPSQPQPTSSADANSGGANGQCPGGPYCSTRDGSPSGNGNGNGAANGKPCAGCVGKADNKNPQGQKPNATDGNNGYECDGNHGIARTNPAHTGCTAATGPSPSPTATESTGPSTGPSGGPKPKPTHTSKAPSPCVSTAASPCVLGETFTLPPSQAPTQVLGSHSSLPFTGWPMTTALMLGILALIAGSALMTIPGRRAARHRGES